MLSLWPGLPFRLRRRAPAAPRERISIEQLENPPYRIIGVVVMVDGVGLVGTLSGFLANAFLASRRQDREHVAVPESDAMRRLKGLRLLVEEQQQ
jgi:hypothetical protein